MREAEEGAARKAFDLALPDLGPYALDFTRNGRFLLLGGRRGHLALLDWQRAKLLCEVQARGPAPAGRGAGRRPAAAALGVGSGARPARAAGIGARGGAQSARSAGLGAGCRGRVRRARAGAAPSGRRRVARRCARRCATCSSCTTTSSSRPRSANTSTSTTSAASRCTA